MNLPSRRRLTAIVLFGLLLTTLFSPVASTAAPLTTEQRSAIINKAASLPIPFLENQGRFPSNIAFSASTFSGSVLVAKDGTTSYVIPASPGGQALGGPTITEQLLSASVTSVQGKETSPVALSSYIGNNPALWQDTRTPYRNVSLDGIYPGVDLKFAAYGNRVEKRILVKPGATPSNIRFAVGGGTLIIDAGVLSITSGNSVVPFEQPTAYQEDATGKTYIPVSFNGNGTDYGFTLGTYDTSRELIIVSGFSILPVAVMDTRSTVALDAMGGAYISVPATPSGLFFANTDSTIDKLTAIAFVGGSWTEIVKAFAVDAAGSLYAAGVTISADFPIISGAFDTSYNGVSDAFILKFSNNLSILSTSTYLGGSGCDAATALNISDTGTVAVSGITYSTDFPVQIVEGGTVPTEFPQFFSVEFDSCLVSSIVSSFSGSVTAALAGSTTATESTSATTDSGASTSPESQIAATATVTETVPAETSGVAGPGWLMGTASLVSSDQAAAYFASLQVSAPAKSLLSVQGFAPMSATTASSEITELARALRYDPKLIYDYVHNNIDYLPYFGSTKGATLTILDGSGNDFDQASLMIALLRASGYTAQYVYGKMTIPGSQLANWLGVDQLSSTIGSVIPSGGIPASNLQSDGTLTLDRVWVKANIGGSDYLFDPAFKTYSYASKIDIASAMSYNQADFLAGATTDATVGADYVQNLNEVNIRSKLTTYANTLTTTIRNQYANKSVEEIVSGRSIVQSYLTQYTTTLPFSPTVTFTWDDVPTTHTTTIRIQHAGIDYTASAPDLSGKRFTLTYAGADHHPELRLDGTLLVSGTATTLGSKNNCTVIINHPYAANSGTYMDQTVTYSPESGRNYAIVYNFGGVSDTLLQKRQQQLDVYKAQGLADTTEAVLGETLNIMGMTWLKEVSQSMKLLSAVTETVPIMHHNVGFMCQEAGYYIDVKAGAGSTISKHNIDADKTANFKVFPLIGSAFEHGILEQLAGSDKPGVSTMKLFQIANSTARKVFLTTSANYATVKPQLVNYTTTELTDFQNQVNSGNVLVLPDNGQLVLNQWKGKGYISKYFSGNTMSMGMIIGGNYFGGYAAYQGPISTPTVTQNTQTAQVATFAPATVNLNISTIQPSTSRDPVDMAGGSFLFDHTDLALGGAAPLGLAFSRSYTSADAMTKRSMGYGWGHNYDIYLTPTSHGEPGIGMRQPIDAAAMIASLYVGFDLLKNYDTPTAWVTSSLVSKWAIDQVIDNSMVVHIGKKVMEFVKLADGTYASPPGITTKLIKNGDGTFSLVERFGSRINFNSNKQASEIKDADGNTLSFTYSGTTLSTIKDAYNRTLTLGYDTSSRLSSVTDSTGRVVTYGYNTNHELTTYIDPETKSWGYGYEPSGSHRMTTLTNPLTITTATNAYDTLGRVMTQTVPRQGAPGTTATYNFYFSGFRNSEVDPSGNATTYYYDQKGREFAVENALGNKSTRQFDGQNHTTQNSDPRSNITGFIYDNNHNLTRITDPFTKETINTYDSLFHLTDVTDPLQHNTHYEYNATHDLILTRDHLSNSFQSSFTGPKGVKDTATDARSTQTSFMYDNYGNPKSSKTAWNPSVNYVYDPIGRMTDLTDQIGAHTSFVYDKRNLVTSITDPSRTFSTGFTYYDDGSLWTKTNRKGTTITYTYTPSGKVESLSAPGWPTVTYTYNLLDQLTAMQDGIGTTSYDSYDAAGRLTSTTNPFGFNIGYLYDAAGNLTGLTYPGNKKVIYSHDALNRLHTVTIDWLPGKPVATYIYDDAGRLTDLTNFNGTLTTYGYDEANRLTSISSPVASYSFSLDGNGNRTGVTQTEPLDTVPPPVTTGYNYNTTRNRLSNAGGNSFGYDNEGQLSSGYGSTYTFDYLHRLTGISDISSYSYDGPGNRLQATRDGVTTRYIYDARGNLLAEADASNSITRYYIHGVGLLAMVTPSDQLYSYHYNATGSTVAVTDQSQTMVNKYAYDPFGNIVNQEEEIPQPFKYVGQFGVMSEPNGFYYMKARYYDPNVGRFVSEDPLGFGGGDVNLMAYVGNQPVNRVDPSGLCGQTSSSWFIPNVTIGLDSPIGGVNTTLPFNSGGLPVTVQTTPSYNYPIGPSVNLKTNIEVNPFNGGGNAVGSITTPIFGLEGSVNIRNGAMNNPTLLGPQANFPLGFGANLYINIKW